MLPYSRPTVTLHAHILYSASNKLVGSAFTSEKHLSIVGELKPREREVPMELDRGGVVASDPTSLSFRVRLAAGVDMDRFMTNGNSEAFNALERNVTH